MNLKDFIQLSKDDTRKYRNAVKNSISRLPLSNKEQSILENYYGVLPYGGIPHAGCLILYLNLPNRFQKEAQYWARNEINKGKKIYWVTLTCDEGHTNDLNPDLCITKLIKKANAFCRNHISPDALGRLEMQAITGDLSDIKKTAHCYSFHFHILVATDKNLSTKELNTNRKKYKSKLHKMKSVHCQQLNGPDVLDDVGRCAVYASKAPFRMKKYVAEFDPNIPDKFAKKLVTKDRTPNSRLLRQLDILSEIEIQTTIFAMGTGVDAKRKVTSWLCDYHKRKDKLDTPFYKKRRCSKREKRMSRLRDKMRLHLKEQTRGATFGKPSIETYN